MEQVKNYGSDISTFFQDHHCKTKLNLSQAETVQIFIRKARRIIICNGRQKNIIIQYQSQLNPL